MGNRCAERCTFSDAQQLYQLEKLGKLPRNFGGFLAFLIFKTGKLGMQGGATRFEDVGETEEEEDVRQVITLVQHPQDSMTVAYR